MKSIERPAPNQTISMTRRHPNLPNKVLKRDSIIVQKIIEAWDKEQDGDKVLAIFLKEKSNLSDERYWEIMRTVWTLCGSLQNQEVFRSLMQSKRRSKYYFSTPEESAALRCMPYEFEVYRACDDENDKGLSWTVDYGYVLRYKEMFSKEKIIGRKVLRSEVFAYIERNNEFEIILL